MKTYKITKETKAIISKDSPYYHSEIWEEGRKRHAIQSPQQIIQRNCQLTEKALEERNQIVQTVLKSNSKLPIAILPQEGIYMFPTSSLRCTDFIMLSYHHIKNYTQRDDRTYVEFLDRTGIYVKASEHIVDMQYKRTSQLIIHDHRSTLFGNMYSGVNS